jgi:flavin reductase (DIM6/NTAB) family NADH-FMN oxidoreductase RutF
MIDSAEFKKTMSRFATGITVVLFVNHEKKLRGMTVNSFNSLSLNPPLILYSIDRKNRYLSEYLDNVKFTVNILSRDQENLSNYFASRDKNLEEFKDYYIEDDFPILNSTLATIFCEKYQSLEIGDHNLIVGQVVKCQDNFNKNNDNPLIYFNSKYM